MDKQNKLLDIDRLDMDSKFTKAVPQKIMASDGNPNGTHLYIEQRAYIAKELEEQGYGNIEQAVREFAEEKVKLLIDELVELLFNDNEPTCKVDNCEKGSDIPCGCSICVEENKQFWKNKIDILIKERFGN